MERAFLTAAEAFAETLEELAIDESIPAAAQRALGQRAALLAAGLYEWKQQVGPTLTGRQLKILLGIKTRQGVHDLLKRGRLLALEAQSGQWVYPSFQFNERGRPHAVMTEVLAHFAGADVSPHTIASWFTSPQALLDGNTPAVWLKRGGEPERVVEAARRSAARLGR